MNERQNKIVKLLWDFCSLREEHIMKICECNKSDIEVLIANRIIIREKTGIIRHKLKDINNRNIVAFDVVMEYLERNPEIKKAKFPISVSLKIGYVKYDIIAIKQQEMDKLYEDIDNISSTDKIIIIIETKKYEKKKINTNKKCCICTYPPLQIVDIIN